MKSIAKALVGGVAAGLTSAGVALGNGSIDPGEWVGIALAALTSFGAIYFTTNTPASTGDHAA